MPWSLSVPPENIRKPFVLMFSGGIKETSGMKWLNDVMTKSKNSHHENYIEKLYNMT